MIGDLCGRHDYLGESGIGAYYYPDEIFGDWVSSRFPWHAYCGDIDLLGWRNLSHYRVCYNTTRSFMA